MLSNSGPIVVIHQVKPLHKQVPRAPRQGNIGDESRKP